MIYEKLWAKIRKMPLIIDDQGRISRILENKELVRQDIETSKETYKCMFLYVCMCVRHINVCVCVCVCVYAKGIQLSPVDSLNKGQVMRERWWNEIYYQYQAISCDLTRFFSQLCWKIIKKEPVNSGYWGFAFIIHPLPPLIQIRRNCINGSNGWHNLYPVQ